MQFAERIFIISSLFGLVLGLLLFKYDYDIYEHITTLPNYSQWKDQYIDPIGKSEIIGQIRYEYTLLKLDWGGEKQNLINSNHIRWMILGTSIFSAVALTFQNYYTIVW